MSVVSGYSSFPSSAYSASAAAAMLPAAANPALIKGEKAAREFEAQLIGTVLQSFEKSFAALPGQNDMAGDDNYNYLGTQALATAIADGGGFGIARMISEHLGARR
jgi:Rod binding domain-containing protein